jgi:hypothetical protein
MNEQLNLFPLKGVGTSKAGLTIHLDFSEEKNEPIDITLYVKKPNADEELAVEENDNSFTAGGKLTFRFGKKGYVELFAENTKVIEDATPPEWGQI